jgi:flagellum-specific ATP synthase
MRRAVVVACPADDPPLMRLHGAQLATSIAEYLRDRGRHVLLLMDSLTRFAHAQREISLAIGEPPATRGYPPSVFARLPQLVERAGNADTGGGSITAFYTVLTEGDEPADPVAEAARAILDGHIVLSRELAEQGHYPAIDVESSVSRAMPMIATREHLALAQRFREIHAAYRQNADMIGVGAYSPGSDPRLDEAIALRAPMAAFLRQNMHEGVGFADAYRELEALLSGVGAAGGSLSAVR